MLAIFPCTSEGCTIRTAATAVGHAFSHRPHPVHASEWITGTNTACRESFRECASMVIALPLTGQTR